MKFKIQSLLIALILWVTAPAALAQEFRKCNVDAVISGVGIPTTVIPGSAFVAWARMRNEKESANRIDEIARICLSSTIIKNVPLVPGICENKPDILNNGDRSGYAASGFQFTNGLNALKNAICDNPSIGTAYSRAAADKFYDKRVIQGFRVSYRKRGKSKACRGGDQIWPTVALTMMCKASEDMPRDKPPFSLYRLSKWPQPPSCKSEFSVRGTGQSTKEAKSAAIKGWISNVARNNGREFSDYKKSRGRDIACLKKLQGDRPVECIVKAKPCYF